MGVTRSRKITIVLCYCVQNVIFCKPQQTIVKILQAKQNFWATVNRCLTGRRKQIIVCKNSCIFLFCTKFQKILFNRRLYLFLTVKKISFSILRCLSLAEEKWRYLHKIEIDYRMWIDYSYYITKPVRTFFLAKNSATMRIRVGFLNTDIALIVVLQRQHFVFTLTKLDFSING